MNRARARAIATAAVVMALGSGLASCGIDDDATTTTSDPTTTSTAVPASTGPTTSSTPTTAPGGSTTSIPEDVAGDALPDGDQVGYLRAIDLGAATVTVDLAELLTGTAAADAYRADTGRELDGEQFYVRNRNPRLRTVPIDPSGYGVIYAATCCGPTSVTLDGLAEAIGGDWQGITAPNPPFNLTVEGGTVTAAVQMYQP